MVILMNHSNFYKTLLKNNIQIDYDVYCYGIKILKSYFSLTLVSIPVLIYFDIFLEGILFLIFFIPLRRYSGGYHFNNSFLCFIFSFIIIFSISYLSAFIYNIPNIFQFFIFVLCVIANYKIGIIDHKNKRISIQEKKLFQKKIFHIEIFYVTLLLIGIYFSIDKTIIIIYAMLVNTINAYVGKELQ